MKRFRIYALPLSLLLSSYALAEGNEKEIYNYRVDMMEASQSHLKALRRYVDGKLAITEHVPSHVEALLAMNGMIKEMFPAGKQHPDTEALASIWSDSRGFQGAIENNRRKIIALQQVDPTDMAAMKRAVNEVRMSCGDCHSYFRDR